MPARRSTPSRGLLARRALACLLLAGCGVPDQPAWTVTTLWIRPSPEGAVRGLATAQYANERWQRRQRDRDQLCAELFEFVGVPVEPCPECGQAWALDYTPGDSLCPWDPRVDRLPSAIGIGPLFAELQGAEPVPDATSGSWTFSEREGWAPHGFVFKGTVGQADTSSPAWDESSPVTAWPAWAVALNAE